MLGFHGRLRSELCARAEGVKEQIVAIYFYLSENTVDQFPFTNLLSTFRHF